MKTKRKPSDKPFNKPLPGFRETAEESAERENAEDKAASDGAKPERFNVSFDLKEDGSPDLSSMRGRTKERVQAFFNDPRIAAAFGAKAPAAAEVQIFHPSMVAGMYAMLGAIEAAAIMRFAQVPEGIAKRVFTYTPEEVQALTPPTCRVLNKYAAEWMIKYQDEIALATMLVAMTVAKVNAAMIMTKMGRTTIGQEPSQAKSEENGEKDRVNSKGPVQ